MEEIGKLADFMKALRVAVKNLQLYPEGSELVKESLKNLEEQLEDLLRQRKVLTLGQSEGKLLVEGKVLELGGVDKAASGTFARYLTNFNLKSISFHQGLTSEEIVVLLKGLGSKQGPVALMKEKGVKKIVLDEKIYIVAGDEKSGKTEGDWSRGPAGVVGVGEVSAEPGGGVRVEKEKVGAPPQPEVSTEEKLTREAEDVLSAERTELLTNKEKREELPNLLRGLDSLNRVDTAGKVVDKLSANLDDTQATVRLEAARSFRELTPTIEGLSDKKIIRGLDEKFIAAEEKEADEQVYTELAELLEEGVSRALRENDYDETDRIISMFRRHRHSGDEGFLKRWNCAAAALQRIANSDVIWILISDLRSEDKKLREETYKVILKLEETAVEPIIKAIGETEDIHLRKVLAYSLKGLGNGAVEKLVESVGADVPADASRRVLEVLDGIGSEQVIVKQLRQVLNHYDPAVRRQALGVLFRINNPQAVEILCEAARDSEPAVAKEAIRYIGKLADHQSVNLLKEIISRNSKVDETVQAEACIALGAIGDAGAVPALFDAARTPAFFEFRKPKALNVRMAAISALSNLQASQSREILQRLAAKEKPEIRKAASAALARQRKVLDGKASKISQRLL